MTSMPRRRGYKTFDFYNPFGCNGQVVALTNSCKFGTNVMIFKMCSQKIWQKIGAFAQATASFCKSMIVCNIGF
jgi:hypothetical protein